MADELPKAIMGIPVVWVDELPGGDMGTPTYRAPCSRCGWPTCTGTCEQEDADMRAWRARDLRKQLRHRWSNGENPLVVDGPTYDELLAQAQKLSNFLGVDVAMYQSQLMFEWVPVVRAEADPAPDAVVEGGT